MGLWSCGDFKTKTVMRKKRRKKQESEESGLEETLHQTQMTKRGSETERCDRCIRESEKMDEGGDKWLSS